MSKATLVQQSTAPDAPAASEIVVYAKTDRGLYWKDDIGVEHPAGGAGGGAAISAGTQSVSTGTVVFSNSNNVSFGMSGSSRITASASFAQTTQPAVNAAAGTQTATSGTVVFANSNNVTFGMSGSTQVTASASFAQTTQPAVNLAAGSQTATSATVVFSNSNGISFGMSGSTRITASADDVKSISAGATRITNGEVVFGDANGMSWGINGQTITITAADVKSISAGATRITNGEVVFSNSNGIAFGANGQTITASFSSRGSLYQNPANAALVPETITVNVVQVQRIHVPYAIDATQLDGIMVVSNSSSGGGSHTVRWGIYTMGGSTASLASSASRTWAYNSTLAGSSYTVQSGTRYRSVSLGTWSVTPGEYLMAVVMSVSTGQTSGSYSWMGGRDMTLDGADFVTVYTRYFNSGMYSATSANLPNSIQLSQVVQVAGTIAGDDVVFPWFNLVGTF